MAGNGPRHHGPCRCVAEAQPAPCTKGNCLKVWAAGPPAIPRHTPPMRDVRGSGCLPHSVGPAHRGCWSFRPCFAGPCTGWQRGRGSHKPTQVYRPPTVNS